MLKEFAFTPQIFDHELNADEEQWISQLRRIGRELDDGRSPTCIVVSGLWTSNSWCAWEEHARQCIGEIPRSSPACNLAQGLLSKMRKLKVERLAIADAMPSDEPDWVNESCNCHEQEPLHRIFAVDPTSSRYQAITKSLSDVNDPEVWKDCVSVVNPSGDFSTYPPIFRPIARCSQFLHVVCPYQTEWQLPQIVIEQYLSISLRKTLPRIHVHFECKREGTANPENQLDFIRTKLEKYHSHANITIVAWPVQTLGERLVLGGLLKDAGKDGVMESLRWGLHISHIHRKGNNPRRIAPQWSLQRLCECQATLRFLNEGLKQSDVFCITIE